MLLPGFTVTSIISEKLGEYKSYQMTKGWDLDLLSSPVLFVGYLSSKGRRHFFLSHGARR